MRTPCGGQRPNVGSQDRGGEWERSRWDRRDKERRGEERRGGCCWGYCLVVWFRKLSRLKNREELGIEALRCDIFKAGRACDANPVMSREGQAIHPDTWKDKAGMGMAASLPLHPLGDAPRAHVTDINEARGVSPTLVKSSFCASAVDILFCPLSDP